MTTFTSNLGLTIPANGADAGNWDSQAANPNYVTLDACLGGVTTVSLNNTNVVLSAAQNQSRMIVFSSTLTGSVTITFATSYIKDYLISHVCTGSSAFTITLETTAASGQVICAVPGQTIQVYNDGTNLKYMNFGGPIGSYWDYGGSSTPNWNDGCTVKPYLNCDGSTFLSSVYPILNLVYSGNTLPNSKGRTRFALDQSAGNISSAAGGFSGSGVGATGGGMTTTLGTSNLPAYTPAGSVTASVGSNPGLVSTPSGPVNIGGTGSGGTVTSGSVSASFTGTAQGGVSQVMTNLPPSYIGGLQLVRAG